MSGSLDNGETVCAIGGQYADAVFPFVLIYNALEGNALDKVEVPVNFIVCKSGQEFSDYMTYLHNDGVYAWTTDEVDQLIKSKIKMHLLMSCLKWARTTVLKIQLQDMENKLLL